MTFQIKIEVPNFCYVVLYNFISSRYSYGIQTCLLNNILLSLMASCVCGGGFLKGRKTEFGLFGNIVHILADFGYRNASWHRNFYFVRYLTDILKQLEWKSEIMPPRNPPICGCVFYHVVVLYHLVYLMRVKLHLGGGQIIYNLLHCT